MVYEYKCNHCGNIIEINHKLNEKPDIIFCDKCERDLFTEEETTKLISLSSFKLNWQHFHTPQSQPYD
jgi:putative FmdB family regulatory protein